MAISYYSIRSWIALGTGESYIIDFPFLERKNVVVYHNAVALNYLDLEWETESQFKILQPVQTNDTIVVRRFTEMDQRLADYHNGATLTEKDLNIVTKQLLYLIQEASDYRVAGLDPEPPPGQSGDPTDPNGLPYYINDIIAEILSTQTFLDLIELIELTDINAEVIMQQSLETHDNWSVDRVLNNTVENQGINLLQIGLELDTIDAQIIDINSTFTDFDSATATSLSGIATRFDAAEASILTLDTAISSLDSATTTSITQLQSSLDDNSALILSVQSTSVTADAVLAGRVDVVEADITDGLLSVNSRIGVVENTYVDIDSSSALIQTQIDTWYTANNWEGLFTQSSFISGVSTTTTENTAEISGITSYLIGANALFTDPSTWTSGSLAVAIADMQDTVTGNTSNINAELTHRNAMFSYFFPGGNTTDSTGFISALEQTWRTYADEESSVVTRTDSLEANQQPIFFRSTAPDPRAQEFAGTRFSTGFPRGTVWHDTDTQTRILTYWWEDTNTVPPGINQSTETYSFSGITGMWVRLLDDDLETQGASIDSLWSAYNNLDNVGGIIDTRIQASVGGDIATINQTMQDWFDTTTGQMYSGWQVRINQYSDGTPTIAGIGLGMENDPNNPEAGSISDFIVMADRFSVIRPPTSTELEGTLDASNVFIPFIVNTSGVAGEPDVIVNGSLFARNTLSANDGFAGRFTFTELDGNGFPVTADSNFDATGSRLVLASDTNGYNLSNSASPFVGGSNPQKFWLWSGTGTMNHNNALFYVDTDGNGFFGGQILADNISGDVSNIHSVDVSAATVTVPNGSTGWYVVATSPELVPSGSRLRTPSIVVNINMFGTGSQAGNGRIEGRSKVNGIWSAWEVIAESPIATPTGTTLTLAGTMASTLGSIQIRSSIQRQQTGSGWNYPSSSYMKGIVTLLA